MLIAPDRRCSRAVESIVMLCCSFCSAAVLQCSSVTRGAKSSSVFCSRETVPDPSQRLDISDFVVFRKLMGGQWPFSSSSKVLSEIVSLTGRLVV